MSEVTAALTTVTAMGTSVISFITGNPILVVFLAASMIGIGFSLFRKARKSAGR